MDAVAALLGLRDETCDLKKKTWVHGKSPSRCSLPLGLVAAPFASPRNRAVAGQRADKSAMTATVFSHLIRTSGDKCER